MSKRPLTAFAVLFASSCFLFSSAAKADRFSFTISTSGSQQYPLTGSGILTTTNAGGGVQYITDISGTIDNSANTLDAGSFPISLVPTTGPGQVSTVSYGAQNGSTFFFTYDNILSPTGTTPLDANGLAFMADGVSYNIGYLGSQALYLGIQPNDQNFDQHTYAGVPIDFTLGPVSMSSSVTPEPSSIALLGTGLLAFAGVARRRFSV